VDIRTGLMHIIAACNNLHALLPEDSEQRQELGGVIELASNIMIAGAQEDAVRHAVVLLVNEVSWVNGRMYEFENHDPKRYAHYASIWLILQVVEEWFCALLPGNPEPLEVTEP